jgi:hypothetical protein
MPRLIAAAADRVLERVAPKAVASACVPPDPWYTCVPHQGDRLYCHYTCSGDISCISAGSC